MTGIKGFQNIPKFVESVKIKISSTNHLHRTNLEIQPSNLVSILDPASFELRGLSNSWPSTCLNAVPWELSRISWLGNTVSKQLKRMEGEMEGYGCVNNQLLREKAHSQNENLQGWKISYWNSRKYFLVHLKIHKICNFEPTEHSLI